LKSSVKTMPMFKIKFKDDYEKEVYTVYCQTQDLDLGGHPYFVTVKKLIDSSVHSPIIEINNKEKKRFRDTKSLLIPIQNIVLIEQVADEKSRIVEVKVPLSPFVKTTRSP